MVWGWEWGWGWGWGRRAAKDGVCAPSLRSALEEWGGSVGSAGMVQSWGRQASTVCHQLIAYRPLAWGLAGSAHPLPLHPCQKTTSYLWSQPSSSAAWSSYLGHFSIDNPGHSCFAPCGDFLLGPLSLGCPLF